ncbi:myeloperoxidase-like isoform X2 [Tigriopus californicus]|uniref:myeloperoxidase-like isoform X2 n=1 Tax=Tigriopus californicus TaxID=6832 RepID=UPI0027DA58A1|nr:myeloperoxidase-like isoform X2 [Tigriopus californicus]
MANPISLSMLTFLFLIFGFWSVVDGQNYLDLVKQVQEIEEGEIAKAYRIAREESVAMELRNGVTQRALEVLATRNRFQIEKDSIDDVETGLHKILNDGQVGGGQSSVVQNIKIIQFACSEDEIKCDPTDPYRSISGICNNLENPKWGAMSTKFRRFLPASYADGISIPRGDFFSAFGFQPLQRESDPKCISMLDAALPNPRLVSNEFEQKRDSLDPIHTNLFVQIGQFLDHDITLTPELRTDQCCQNPTQAGCFSIITDDLRPPFSGCDHQSLECAASKISPGKTDEFCFEFVRSTPFCQESPYHVREQMNAITAYVDGSQIYGSDVERAISLRTLKQGQLRTSGQWLLPRISLDGSRKSYTAGDVRALENPGLTALHTLWVREHNRIAQELQGLFPFWSDEILFQESRRLVIAQWQNVVFGQFATTMLGPTRMDEFGLTLISPSQHDVTADSSIRNSFASAAYRFGHSMVQKSILVMPLNGSKSRNYPLKDNFFLTELYESGSGQGLEEILLGMFHQGSQNLDRFIVNDMRSHLFENIFGFQSDLMTRNIQRGRDHGIPSYNDFREFCGLSRPCDWNQIPLEVSPNAWASLQTLYSDPDDVDLFVGGITEAPLQGGVLGPTFACLIGKQLNLLKFGDRFFFSHVGAHPRSFSAEEIALIRNRHLGDLLCDNTQVTSITTNLFMMNAPAMPCKNRTMLDLSLLDFTPVGL